MRRSRAAVLGALLAGPVLATGPPALAHALLERAVPAVGATVEAPPAAVELEFSEPVEAAFCRVEVTERRTGQAIRAEPLENPEPRTLLLPLPALGAGVYEVHWSAVSVDTHATEGRFRFEVSPR